MCSSVAGAFTPASLCLPRGRGGSKGLRGWVLYLAVDVAGGDCDHAPRNGAHDTDVDRRRVPAAIDTWPNAKLRIVPSAGFDLGLLHTQLLCASPRPVAEKMKTIEGRRVGCRAFHRAYRLGAGTRYPKVYHPMARIIRLIEIELNGSCFHIDFGGHVALAQNDAAVAVVKVDTVEDAARLETLAAAMHPISFRWKQGHNVVNDITVGDFERKIAADPSRYLPEAAIDRLGFRPKDPTATVKPDHAE